jgi:hypothetical protein
LSDIGKEKAHACRLPCKIRRAVRMKTTLRTTVRSGSPARLCLTPPPAAAGPKPRKIEDRRRDAGRSWLHPPGNRVAGTRACPAEFGKEGQKR